MSNVDSALKRERLQSAGVFFAFQESDLGIPQRFHVFTGIQQPAARN